MPYSEDYGKKVNLYIPKITITGEENIQQGDLMCLDITGLDIGLLGSNNTLACNKNGRRRFYAERQGYPRYR